MIYIEKKGIITFGDLMDFKRVDKESFKVAIPYLQNEKINEYGFTPTCVYAPMDNAKFAKRGEWFVLKFEDEGLEHINILGDFKAEGFEVFVKDLLNEFKILRFDFLSKEKAEILEKIFAERVESVKTDETQWDYIYEINDFINMTGKQNRHKREQYNAFVNNNNFRYEEINENNKSLCIEICETWCERKDCSLCEYTCEKNIIKEIIDNLDCYPVKGGILYVNETPSAFFIGEVLGDTLMGYHQKTTQPLIKGLGTAIYIQSLENSFKEIKYFNIGPDLGIDGLKQFKRMFKPFSMVEKYSMVIK